jgi:hypothetical protein
MRMSGQKCRTISQDIEAEMVAEEDGVTITYLSGKRLFIPRATVERGISRLIRQGSIDKDEVHLEITNQNGAITDRLMAVLRMLPGVEIESRIPRKLSYVPKI